MDRGLEFLFYNDINNINTYTRAGDGTGPEPQEVGGVQTFGYEATKNGQATQGVDQSGLEIVSKFGDKLAPGRQRMFINYRGQRWNRNLFKPYSVETDALGEHVDQDDISVSSLVEWSRSVPMSRLDYRDFVYCKHLGKYSNNRLIILRRYSAPITNQVFGKEGPDPISTVVSWVAPDKENMFSLSFSEGWEVKDASLNLFEVFGELFDNLGAGKLLKSKGVSGKNILSNPFLKTFQAQILKELGVTGLDVEEFYGNPNIIKSAAWRNPERESFEATISFDVEATYELRYINGIDPHVAMLDIIANLVRMGTRNAVWQINTGFGQGVKSVVNKFLKGDSIEAVKQIIRGAVKALQTVAVEVIGKLRSLAERAKEIAKIEDKEEKAQQALNEAENLAKTVLTTFVQGLLAEYKHKLYAAVAGSTGSPSGHWHLMIGNPKKPVISAGDLVCSDVELSVNNQLGFDDWPTEINVKYKMVNARNLAAQDIESIFNAGQQRIYYSGIYKPGSSVTVQKQTADGIQEETVEVSDVGFKPDVDLGPNLGTLSDNVTPVDQVTPSQTGDNAGANNQNG